MILTWLTRRYRRYRGLYYVRKAIDAVNKVSSSIRFYICLQFHKKSCLESLSRDLIYLQSTVRSLKIVIVFKPILILSLHYLLVSRIY